MPLSKNKNKKKKSNKSKNPNPFNWHISLTVQNSDCAIMVLVLDWQNGSYHK